MANPLPNEEALYQKIEKENLTVHPVIWDLLSHHIGNDLYVVAIIIGGTVLNSVNPRPLTQEEAETINQRVASVKTFMDRLRKVTRKEAGF
jgi:hypothetical protein